MTWAGKLDVARLVRGTAALALLALYGELLYVRFSNIARDVASDTCGQLLYPDIRHLGLQIAAVAVATPVLAFLARKWPVARLAIVAIGLSAHAVFMFAAHMSDVLLWSCDIGGVVELDYATGLVGISTLVWMGNTSVRDVRRGSSGAVGPSDKKVAAPSQSTPG